MLSVRWVAGLVMAYVMMQLIFLTAEGQYVEADIQSNLHTLKGFVEQEAMTVLEGSYLEYAES